MRFQTVGDYARHAFPLHRAVGGDELRADGHTIVAHYSEPMKAVRVLETAGHEFGHLELALVRLDVRSVPAVGRRAERPPPCRELTFEELFDVHDDPPEWVGVAAVFAVAIAALVALWLLIPTIGTVPAIVCSLGGAVLLTMVGFVIAARIGHARRWHRYEAEPQPMALAAVRIVGDDAITSLVALMERFEPESIRVVVADGWRSPQRSRRDRDRRRGISHD